MPKSLLQVEMKAVEHMRSNDPPPTSLFSGTSANLVNANTDSLPSIPNYQLDRIVGTGGFGRVFKATRKSDGQVFAIKLLHCSGGVPADLRHRFLREGTVLCQLDHPRIVSFRELGFAGNDLYLVIDYVESVPWNELSVNLGPAKKIAIATGIIDHCLDALIYAHSKSIVHRDIKPSNILLENRKGKVHVRLADFGLAKNYLQAGHSGVTSDHEIGGTLSYLAPELLNGIKRDLIKSLCERERPPLRSLSSQITEWKGALDAFRRMVLGKNCCSRATPAAST